LIAKRKPPIKNNQCYILLIVIKNGKTEIIPAKAAPKPRNPKNAGKAQHSNVEKEKKRDKILIIC